MDDKKKDDEHLPGYDPRTQTTTLPANSDYKPADFSAGSFPTHAKVITKKDDQMVEAPPPPPVGYAEGGIVQPDDQSQAINDYFTNQKQAVDQFGPDKQKAVADYVLKQNQGIGNKVGEGLAGFGDALLTSAGKQTPGYLAHMKEQDQRDFENATNLGKSLNEQNQAGIKEKMAMDQMNPTTAIGNSHPMLPLLSKVMPGLQPEQYSEILANPRMLSTIMPQAAELTGKQIEAGPRAAEVDVSRGRAITDATRVADEARHNKAEEELTAKGRETENRKATIQAAENIVKDYSPLKPGGPSRHEYNEALKVLSTSITGQNGISNNSQFNHEAIPSGQTYQAPDGTWRKKR